MRDEGALPPDIGQVWCNGPSNTDTVRPLTRHVTRHGGNVLCHIPCPFPALQSSAWLVGTDSGQSSPRLDSDLLHLDTQAVTVDTRHLRPAALQGTVSDSPPHCTV